MKKFTVIMLILIGISISNIKTSFAQQKQSIAVVNIDTKGLEINNELMTSLVNLELEKMDIYEVLDKYDVSMIIKKNGINIEDCFGKSQLVDVGKILNSDKMLSGSAEKFGDKIVVVFRLIDIQSERIEKADVMEYIDQESEIQRMIQISLNNINEIENDKNLVDLLSNFNKPVTTDNSKLNLNGPRFGASYTTGLIGQRMQASKDVGGYNMFPLTSMFGYQFEVQFISAGDFQALLEFIPALNSLESGNLIPSLSIMNGFRFNKSGWEIGVGPVFRMSKTSQGYFDADNNWNRLENLDPESLPQDITIVETLDRRGDVKFTSGLIIGVGKTFKSGYLNVPVNLYYSPRKDGSIIGISFGFNVAKRSSKN